MQPDRYARAIVNDLFDDEIDEEYFAGLERRVLRPRGSAPAGEAPVRSQPSPCSRRRLN